MRSIVLLNQKGGVGKTSTCHHLAGTLAKRGRRVLCLDVDPQASLTQGFFGPEWTRSLDPSRSIAAYYTEEGFDPSIPMVVETPVQGVSIIPGSARLNSFNLPDPEGDHRQFVLREALADLEGQYDDVLIDCPPNLCLCSWSALAAADGVIVPLQAEDYGAQGIFAITGAIEAARQQVNASLELYGFLITMFNKALSIHVAYASQLRDLYGSKVFATEIPLAKDFKEAVASRLPISHYKPKSAPAKTLIALAAERDALTMTEAA